MVMWSFSYELYPKDVGIDNKNVPVEHSVDIDRWHHRTRLVVGREEQKPGLTHTVCRCRTHRKLALRHSHEKMYWSELHFPYKRRKPGWPEVCFIPSYPLPFPPMTSIPPNSTGLSINDTTAIEKATGLASKHESSVSLAENASLSSRNEVGNLNAKLANPLAGIQQDDLIKDGEAFALRNGLEDMSELFKKGALVAQDPLAFENLPLLTETDKQALRDEISNKWRHPKMLYYLVILCSGKLKNLWFFVVIEFIPIPLLQWRPRSRASVIVIY